MNIEKEVMQKIKQAMLDKDKVKLEAFRAIKNAFIQLKTAGKGIEEVTDEQGIQVIQKLVKQRNESAQIYKQQNREDLFDKESAEAEAMSVFLPKMLSEEETKAAVQEILTELGVTQMSEMGKAMGVATKKLVGKVDNSLVSKIVRELLA